MSDTRALIEQLAGRANAVRPLPSPMKRTVAWTLGAFVLIAVMAASYGLRPDLLAALSQPAQALEWTGSVLTGVFAAYATFQISIPGRSPSWAWLPALPLAMWLGGIGLGCLHDFAIQGPAAFAFQTHSGECARAIIAMSLPLALVMAIMVRHAGVVRPAPTAMLAVLSAAALCSAGVSLFHSGENALMSLVWHFGAVTLLSLISVLFGGKVFSWIGHARRA
ncbi:MAG TPA: DUF1109 domain-containing protein [Arenimonas sp.]|uniref:DUF1109 domain-containing protein n=1 Tax=Arenimonas sp. TaxID=1872635 RepID=UPI002CFB6506|nr:DUF1109 domain-containing protein [Arenimonas sp.]HMB56537.1 DUF1109 domain-containing protein [Arenimonas sp.]